MEPKVPITFEGNNYDLMAVAGVILSAGILLSCVPGLSCLWPFLPGILGIIGLVTADQAVDANRTKKLSWVALGVSGLYLLFIVAMIGLYIAFFGFAVAMSSQQP